MASIYLTLKLDDALETAVRQLWQQLREAGLPAPGPTALRPHITLAGYDNIAPEQAAAHIHTFAARRPSLPLSFHSLGIFPENRVLFLAVIVTRPLLRLQRELLGALGNAGLPPPNSPHFHPDRWIPHCSLLIETSSRGLTQGLNCLTAGWKPVHGRTVGIGLVRLPEKADSYYFPFAAV
jgi:2'-5' RNA ligase